jgi:formylglycine-generating enzyme required for sulfatase activity/dienelactone hydrolase
MLTGKTPFAGATPLETAVKRVNEQPKPPKAAVPGLSERWNAAVLKCLEREPSRRFPSAAALLQFLEQPVAMVRRGRVVSLAVVAATAVVLVAVGAAWWGGLFGRRHNERWVRDEVIPELHRLVDADKVMDAELLALKANRLLPGNPALNTVWRTFAREVTINSTPPGARVYLREYEGTDTEWHDLGTTPLSVVYPRGAYRLRLELEGYRPYEAAGTYWSFTQPFPLDRVGSLPDDLLHVPGGHFGVGEEGHEEELGDYFIDRYEVTNRRYKAFVDAGGYKRPEFWRYPFVKDKRELTFSQAVAHFTDKTGRPGPSTWELSSYPQGQENYPVGGVSWYEAAAFAAFEGRDLPTTYHWFRAGGRGFARWMVLASNFDGKGPAPVGQSKAISRFGASDMAGNVREWCLNELTGRGGARVIAGGGWNDPTYTYMDTAGQPPWDRSPTNGLRLVTYPSSGTSLDHAREPVVFEFRDYSKEKPVGDAEFRIYQRLYAYDRRPLNAVVERSDAAPDWTRERITFDAAYGKERMVAYLYLPKGGKPPYQTVVYFPGSNALFLHTIDEDIGLWDFIVRSGRAFIYPIYKGTFERQADIKSDAANGSVAYRDAVVQWAQDLSRSIDYLDTRADIDQKRLGYFGVSWGAGMGGLMPAVEPRIRAAVLDVAGLDFGRPLPEADVFNFLPRVKIPVLMLNGRYDEYFPVETSQNPMFQTLGTPPGQKRHVIYEAGHFVPRVQLIQETIDWYDRYLGPVSESKLPGPK